MGASSSVPEKSIHEFTVKDSKGNDVNLSSYKGKVLLVVNVASKWFDTILNSQVKVNGPNAAPVYKFLKASKGGWFGSQIKWNFTKFLVDRDGNVIKRYATSTTPLAIEGDVKKALGES
ncbi:probable glutathione peroxidase 4 [Salvia hispanica]|uniref:probable glutathione peroxidase 4 n=1 Tax=Salvia hispanica TaxID=49212 RepID=UPI002009A5B7|nr:probable glutathione peroxidase 4 [Salvia hispanica]